MAQSFCLLLVNPKVQTNTRLSSFYVVPKTSKTLRTMLVYMTPHMCDTTSAFTSRDR